MKRMIILFILSGVFYSCKDNPTEAPSSIEEIEVHIIKPKPDREYWRDEPIPCEAIAEGFDESQISWSIGTQQVNCINGKIAHNPGAGRYSVSARVSSTNKAGSAGVSIEIFDVIQGTTYYLNPQGKLAHLEEGVNVTIKSGGETEYFKSQDNGSFVIRSRMIENVQDGEPFNVCVITDKAYDACVRVHMVNWEQFFDKDNFSFILVPKNWHVQSEVYNETIDIDLSKALKRSGGARHEDGKSFYPQDGFASIAPQDRPISTYLDQVNSKREITTEDSLHFKEEIEKMERYLGIGKIFTLDSEPKDKQIKVTYSHDGPVDALKIIRSGKIVGGRIRLRHKNNMTERVIMHEAIHIMGMGHTCEWKTVMSACGSDATTIRSNVPTIWDVGYIQLLYQVRDLQHEMNIPFGIIEAYQAIKD